MDTCPLQGTIVANSFIFCFLKVVLSQWEFIWKNITILVENMHGQCVSGEYMFIQNSYISFLKP